MPPSDEFDELAAQLRTLCSLPVYYGPREHSIWNFVPYTGCVKTVAGPALWQEFQQNPRQRWLELGLDRALQQRLHSFPEFPFQEKTPLRPASAIWGKYVSLRPGGPVREGCLIELSKRNSMIYGQRLFHKLLADRRFTTLEYRDYRYPDPPQEGPPIQIRY